MLWTLDQFVSCWFGYSSVSFDCSLSNGVLSSGSLWQSQLPVIVNSALLGVLLQRTALNTLSVIDAMATVESILLGSIFQYVFLLDLFSLSHNPANVVFLLVAVSVEAAVGMLVLLCAVRAGISVVFSR